MFHARKPSNVYGLEIISVNVMRVHNVWHTLRRSNEWKTSMSAQNFKLKNTSQLQAAAAQPRKWPRMSATGMREGVCVCVSVCQTHICTTFYLHHCCNSRVSHTLWHTYPWRRRRQRWGHANTFQLIHVNLMFATSLKFCSASHIRRLWGYHARLLCNIYMYIVHIVGRS